MNTTLTVGKLPAAVVRTHLVLVLLCLPGSSEDSYSFYGSTDEDFCKEKQVQLFSKTGE